MCDCELCEEIVEIVIKGLAQLDNVLCAVMLSSFKSIIDVGLMFVPGGQATTAVKAAVQGAKSFYQNGEEASSFFGNWIGPACGVPDFDFDITMVFGDLVGAPDSMSRGPPVGCKKKSGCRNVDPVPDPKDKPDKPTDKPADKPTDQPTDKPTETTQPITTSTQTTSSSTSSSTTGAACAYCGEFDKKKALRDDKYGVMYARAATANNGPVCIKPPAEDIPSKRGLGWNQLTSRSFSLFSRALSEKNSKVDTTLGKLNQYKWTCSVGKYAPSSDAANIAEITKYWRFKDPQNNQKCSVEVEQETNAAAVSISDYESKQPSCW